MSLKDNKDAYQTWLGNHDTSLDYLASKGSEVNEEMLKAEPDLVAAPEEPKQSPELEAAIELIQDGGLQLLTALQQQVFQLSVVEGKSLREVGKELDMSFSTVQEHLTAIGKKLRPLVEERM